MISAMRNLALLDLQQRFKAYDIVGMSEFREKFGAELAPMLVEDAGKVQHVYVLQEVPDKPGLVKMWVEELDKEKRLRLPFNKPSGSQSPAIGPIMKRTLDLKKKPGPSLKIQKSTMESFKKLSLDSTEWSGYFKEVVQIFSGNTLVWQGKEYPVGENGEDPHILAAATRLISEKETVFLTVADSEGRWPGDRPEYHLYLGNMLAKMKYVTGAAPSCSDGTCPLCASKHQTLYPNALKGAGINLANMDRAGSFSKLDTGQAWKNYGLCLDCADLLYIFKNHVSQDFVGVVAGQKALLLPFLLGNPEGQHRFIKDFREYVDNLDSKRIKALERNLMEFFADQDDAQMVLHIMWAKFGQVIDEVTGVITDVLPSRLRALADLNRAANKWAHPLAPQHPIEEADFDLSLGMMAPLFKRPGGKKAKQANASARLWELKRQLAASIYHGKPLADTEQLFWDEVITTADWYLTEALATGNAWGLCHEGVSVKKKRIVVYWTLAGWMRHLARFIDYLRKTEVLPMDDKTYVFEPEMEALKPYFSSGSGIDAPEKAYSFLLGILYGKLLQVQAARGVNVASNALTWLKRLNLSGRDLPELYVKIREKMLAYGTEGNKDVRALEKEIGRLGILLGNEIALDNIPTCYFLLLGQSIMADVIKKKNDTDKEVADHD